MSREIDRLKDQHNASKMERSRKSHSNRRSQQQVYLDVLRMKQEEEYRRMQQSIGGIGTSNIAPIMMRKSKSAKALNRRKEFTWTENLRQSDVPATPEDLGLRS